MILRPAIWRVGELCGRISVRRATFATKPPGRWAKSGAHRTTSKGFISSRLPQAQNARNPASIPDATLTPPDTVPQSPETVSDTLHDTKPEDNNLLAPVHIPEDPDGILNEKHPATKILANSAIVVQRQIEMMNIMLGFEQANRYTIMDPQGNHLGYMAEQEFGMGNMLARQSFRTHRSFTTHVFDREMKEVLRFHRPFSWISSRIRVYDPLEIASSSQSTSTALEKTTPGDLSTNLSDLPSQISSLSLSEMRIIGEAQQQWAPLARKYNLFLHRPSDREDNLSPAPQLASGELPLSSSTQLQTSSTPPEASEHGYSQFAYVNEPFLSWDFSLKSSSDQMIGSVNRNFAGFGREIFTDTGVYALRMDSVGLAEEPRHLISKTGERGLAANDDSRLGMSLDQRAVMLATAVSIDFDYFSRKRSGIGGFMPLWFPMGGEAAGAAAAGEAGGVAAGEAGAGAVGGVARGGVAGVGEGATGAAAGMGTMAGYEAMQRGAFGDDASPSAGQSDYQGAGQAPSGQYPGEQQLPDEEVWGEQYDQSGRGSGGSSGGGSGGDSGGGGGDGGGGFDIEDWF
ncbi:hypothetical protein MMC26_006918 [Xylographa opegraphella]|nr:hypothetical protein [Xylographa opegraphella]